MVMPKFYVSTATLGMNEAGVRDASVIMLAPDILDFVENRYPNPSGVGKSKEARRRHLLGSIEFSVPKGQTRKTTPAFIFSVRHTDPATAQAINMLLIEKWIEASKPRPFYKAELEAKLAHSERQLASVSAVIERFEGETPKLFNPGSLQGELATSMVGLLKQRAALIDSIEALRRALRGSVTKDVIISPPSFPTESDGPSRTFFAAAAFLISVAFLSLFVLFCHGVELVRNRPGRAAQFDRIRQAVAFWR
jgi:hypothetical protein